MSFPNGCHICEVEIDPDAGSLPSAVSAVLDALASRGISHLDLPMTPQRVWSALQQARR